MRLALNVFSGPIISFTGRPCSSFRFFHAVCLIIFTTPHRNYKLIGPLHLRVALNKEHLLSRAPHRPREGPRLQTKRPVEKLLQSETTSDPPETSQTLTHHLHHHNRRSDSLSLHTRVDRVKLAPGSQMASRDILTGKQRNEARSAPTSFFVSARKNLSAGTNALSPTNALTFNNIIHTNTTCQPKSHIFFLKTHKTASSTILNILYRYGEGRNLTFALPLNKHSQLFYPHFFASHFVEGVSSRSVKEFNIMCNHMRFMKSEVSPGVRKRTNFNKQLIPCFQGMQQNYNGGSRMTTLIKMLNDFPVLFPRWLKSCLQIPSTFPF